jgi:hypothetical protein
MELVRRPPVAAGSPGSYTQRRRSFSELAARCSFWCRSSRAKLDARLPVLGDLVGALLHPLVQ